jgi:hypothetical protein
MARLLGPLPFRLSQQFLTDGWAHPDRLVMPMLIHAGIWVPIGAVSGVALGLGLGGGPMSTLRATLGGIVGAVIATVVFDVAGAVVFPLAKTTDLIATSPWARLAPRLLVALFTAALAAREAMPASPKAAPTSAAAT